MIRKPNADSQNAPRVLKEQYACALRYPFYRSILLLEIQKYYPG